MDSPALHASRTVTAWTTRRPRPLAGVGRPIFVAAFALLFVGAAPAPERDSSWAEPLVRPGLPNLFRVGPGLYRGAQPKQEGFAELTQLGIRTVVSLRAFHAERKQVQAQGLGYERISFKVWHAEDEDVRRFLDIVTDPSQQPVFVHCQRGADRTGMMIAAYRICVQGWSHTAAIDEMINGGFAFSPKWRNLIGWVRAFDPSRYAACRPR
jgi:protein tyrosine phosphatase (PTP) superfamily phosphohydrolase (DUF442 family)